MNQVLVKHHVCGHSLQVGSAVVKNTSAVMRFSQNTSRPWSQSPDGFSRHEKQPQHFIQNAFLVTSSILFVISVCKRGDQSPTATKPAPPISTTRKITSVIILQSCPVKKLLEATSARNGVLGNSVAALLFNYGAKVHRFVALAIRKQHISIHLILASQHQLVM